MRGVLYSGIMVIVVITIFSIMALQKETASNEREKFSLKQEVDGMDSSYRSVERSLHVLSDVSLRRSIISGENSILGRDSFFTEGPYAPEVLKQLMWNGTLPSNQSAVEFMDNNTLEYNIGLLEDYYKTDSRKYNVSIYFDYSNTTVGIYDAFTLFFNSTVEVNISKPGVANLSRKIDLFEKVSIIGFEDQVYLINVTDGKDSRIIEKSGYIDNFTERLPLTIISSFGNCYGGLTSDANIASKNRKIYFNTTIYPGAIDSFCGVIFVSGSAPNTSYLKVSSVSSLSTLEGRNFLLLGNGEDWGINSGLFDVTNLISYMHEGGYVNSTSGPSFFDILEGRTICTYCATYGSVGLETLINKNRLSTPELHLVVDTGSSNAIGEYLDEISGSKIGMNETSVDPDFYEFRLGDSMRNYFR